MRSRGEPVRARPRRNATRPPARPAPRGGRAGWRSPSGRPRRPAPELDRYLLARAVAMDDLDADGVARLAGLDRLRDVGGLAHPPARHVGDHVARADARPGPGGAPPRVLH